MPVFLLCPISSIAESLAKPFVFSEFAIFGRDEKMSILKAFDYFFEKKLNLWRKWENFDVIKIQDNHREILVPVALLNFREGIFVRKTSFKTTSDFFKYGELREPSMLHVKQAERFFQLEFAGQIKLWLEDFPKSLAVPPKNASDSVKLGYFFIQDSRSELKQLFTIEELELFKKHYSSYMADLKRHPITAH